MRETDLVEKVDHFSTYAADLIEAGFDPLSSSKYKLVEQLSQNYSISNEVSGLRHFRNITRPLL